VELRGILSGTRGAGWPLWVLPLGWGRAKVLMDQLNRARLAYEQYVDDFDTGIPEGSKVRPVAIAPRELNRTLQRLRGRRS